MLHATQSQHGHNIVATWEEEGGGPLVFGCCVQSARNILATFAP
jgi:hypothetical protein